LVGFSPLLRKAASVRANAKKKDTQTDFETTTSFDVGFMDF